MDAQSVSEETEKLQAEAANIVKISLKTSPRGFIDDQNSWFSHYCPVDQSPNRCSSKTTSNCIPVFFSCYLRVCVCFPSKTSDRNTLPVANSWLPVFLYFLWAPAFSCWTMKTIPSASRSSSSNSPGSAFWVVQSRCVDPRRESERTEWDVSWFKMASRRLKFWLTVKLTNFFVIDC